MARAAAGSAYRRVGNGLMGDAHTLDVSDADTPSGHRTRRTAARDRARPHSTLARPTEGGNVMSTFNSIVLCSAKASAERTPLACSFQICVAPGT